MADLREVFPSLIDDSTGAGEALISRTEGEVAAAKAGSIGFAFKDSAGNVVLPQLTAEGKISVTTDAGDCLKDAQKVGGSATEVAVCTISLTVDKVYTNISAHAACFRDSVFRVYHLDDAAEIDLGYIICGPGDFTGEFAPNGLEVTAGSTGTQELRIKALNLTALSDFRASLICKVVA